MRVGRYPEGRHRQAVGHACARPARGPGSTSSMRTPSSSEPAPPPGG
jgi:hypothetical protein